MRRCELVGEVSDYSIYRRVVSQLMQGEEQLPSLPKLTLDIRRALSDGAINTAALARLIGRDPALSALLMKHASCALYRHPVAPKTLQDVIALLGMREVDRITMVHSVKSLFTLHSPGLKQLFTGVWAHLTLKAGICVVLSRLLGTVAPEHALLACLLGEVGSLAVLSAFKSEAQVPSAELYYKLCREYSKSLGVILLKKWAVDDEYIQVIRCAGNWQYSAEATLGLIDLVNLALYHAVRVNHSDAELPLLATLAAYQKLAPPLNFVNARGELELVIKHWAEVDEIANTLR